MSILRADSIRDRAGTGAPDFPNGLTGNLTGTATTATTLSGTPNISVGTLGCGNVTSTGDVTGVNATFSGNLTVQGTTTTIDTAITAVDSLEVEGSVGINKVSPSRYLEIGGTSNNPQIRLSNGAGTSSLEVLGNAASGQEIRFGTEASPQAGRIIYHNNDNSLSYSNTGGERLRITSGGTAIFKAGLAEKFNNTGTTMSSGTHAIQSGNIIRFTGNESGANALNITGIHSTLANGEALSFTVICTPNNSGYISGFNIDGVAPATAIKWSGGSAPSASSSGQDVYTFTVLKIGTATNAYEVYGAMTNYA